MAQAALCDITPQTRIPTLLIVFCVHVLLLVGRCEFRPNRGLYSNKPTDLAEISASLCVVQLMHNRSPPCDTTCLQLHLVLSRWPKGSALLHHT